MGTTDIYHDGSLEDPRVTYAEVLYLLRAVQAHYPDRRLTERDIVAAFAGVRPVLDSHSENPSEASREEDIWEERGMLSVAGGKLTTWRYTAEEAVDEALKLIPQEISRRVARCHTTGTPLVDLAPVDLGLRLRQAHQLASPIAEGMARRLRAAAWLVPHVARREKAWQRYLRRLPLTRSRMARRRTELDPLIDGIDLCAAEVRAHLAFSGVVRLEDLLLRRVRIGLWQPSLAREIAPRLRSLFEQELGWDHQHWDRELDAFHQALQSWSPEGVVR